jgi:2-polyprenyl-3-methyl-5-hydroxy-6-metoxy-1,4-benzoquinol methylase
MLTGFSPRKQNLTLYLMGGFDTHADLLKKLGKHKTSVGCLYIKKLEDVDKKVLKELIKKSFNTMKQLKQMTLQRDPEGLEQKTLHALVDFKDKRVLEVGCGEGRLTFKYAAASSLTVGFDPDHDALRIARADSPHDLQKHVPFC